MNFTKKNSHWTARYRGLEEPSSIFCKNLYRVELRLLAANRILPGLETGHILAAFLEIPGVASTTDDMGSTALSPRLLNISKDVEVELAKHLPAYMTPTIFFAMPKLPLTLTGKINRTLLRDIGGSFFSVKQVAQEIVIQGKTNMLRTNAERQLRDLWVRVFNIASDSIGADSNFLRLGDSVAAMKLVGEARKVGIRLTVADIFRNPVLAEMSKFMKADVRELCEENSTASLLDLESRAAFVSNIASSGVGLRAEDIVEILPLTDMQESFIVEGLSENRQFVDYYYLELGLTVDLAKLRESCGELLQIFPILRAYFLPYGGKHWMVIPKHLHIPFHIINVDSNLEEAIEDFCLRDIATFKRKQLIISFVLLRHKTEGMRLIVRLSHAQYDAISIEVLFNALMGTYQSEKIPELTDFSTYIAHIARQRSTSISYWRKVLKGAKYVDFGAHFLPKIISDSIPIPFRTETETLFPNVKPEITLASFMSAAWALFLWHFLKQDEVIYGRLISGRNAALPATEEIVGCCINVVPVRLSLSPDMTVENVVQAVQEQFAALGEADALGFRDVVHNCAGWPTGAGIYSCTMHQNINENLAFEIEGFTGRLRRFENHRRLPLFLYMISFPHGNRLGVQIHSHSHMVSIETARALLDDFCPLVGRLATALDASIPIADAVRGLKCTKRSIY